MKRINNSVNVLSTSTVATVLLSAVAMTLLTVVLMASAGFAKSVEIGDEFGGPGIGIDDSTWDGFITNRIYGYGNLNGVVGDIVDEHNAVSSDGPGMEAQLRGFGSIKVYNEGGPGYAVSALSGTESICVEYGPRAVDSTADPSDYIKFLTMKPGDFTFVGGSKADKLGK